MIEGRILECGQIPQSCLGGKANKNNKNRNNNRTVTKLLLLSEIVIVVLLLQINLYFAAIFE